LAYLLNPLVNRLERFGMKRSNANFFITGPFLVSVGGLLLLAIPIIGAQVAASIDDFPAYLQRLRLLVRFRRLPYRSATRCCN
jgi:predicted PurR-regulated permease PerM